jgi:flavin reductase (DIM6/NTAB) family NADH-FMN oxidoreductase RutF
MHIKSEPSILYFGTPVVLISTKNENGTDNLAPMSSIFWLGWRCTIGLAAASKTTQNLMQTRQYPPCKYWTLKMMAFLSGI